MVINLGYEIFFQVSVMPIQHRTLLHYIWWSRVARVSRRVLAVGLAPRGHQHVLKIFGTYVME